jgi:simple sugar transport system substrate-binding protein
MFATVVATVYVGAAGSAPAQEPLDVRVITATSTTQGTWDPSQYRAYSKIAKQRNWDFQVAEAVAYGQADQVLDRWGAEGVDIVFSTDNGFQPNMLKAAAAYPNTLWVTMSDLSTTNNLKNVAAYSVNWCEVGFLQGAAGALVSKTGTVAAVESIPILPASKTMAGMRIGAQAAKPGTKVVGQIVGDFDPQKSAEVAGTLIEQGADVIYAVVTGSAAPAVAARAQQAGKWYVGSYGDEARFAPKSTVTSAVLLFGLGYGTVADQREDGTFKPGIIRRGIEDGYIKLTPFRLGLAKSLGPKMKAVLKQLAAGKYAKQMAACQALKK